MGRNRRGAIPTRRRDRGAHRCRAVRWFGGGLTDRRLRRRRGVFDVLSRDRPLRASALHLGDVDGEPIEAVLPAPLTVNRDRLLDLAGGSEIRLAQEEELRRLFPGCEAGAMPPFGPLSSTDDAVESLWQGSDSKSQDGLCSVGGFDL